MIKIDEMLSCARSAHDPNTGKKALDLELAKFCHGRAHDRNINKHSPNILVTRHARALYYKTEAS